MGESTGCRGLPRRGYRLVAHGPFGLFESPKARPILGSNMARYQEPYQTSLYGDHKTQVKRAAVSFGEPEKHRLLRELQAADERLASVRDGRGYMDCSRMERDMG